MATSSDITNPSRRHMLGAGIAIPALALAVPAFASPHPSLEAEMDRVYAWETRLNVGGYSDAEWCTWEDAHDKVLRRVEALPNTPGNARLRAKAVKNLYRGEPIFEDEDTTDYRLARQIIEALAA